MTPPSSKTTTRVKRLMALPYIVGTVWAFLLPTASILTGNFTKPRGWYVDENSLETSNIRVDYKYQAVPKSQQQEEAIVPLCDLLAGDMPDNNNIECIRHGDYASTASFDMVKILPTGNTLDPSNEAIALVAPYPSSGDWTRSQLHFNLLQLLRRLACPDDTPWLAKTIFLISPTSNDSSLKHVVNAFLESYSGSYNHINSAETEPLAPSMANAMIRNLLVLDTEPSQDPQLPKDEVRILPQGHLGVLPNMDLVFVTMAVFSRTPNVGGVSRRAPASDSAPTILYHPYSQETRQWQGWVKELIIAYQIPKPVEGWAINLGNLVLFCRNLVQGPYGLHALALDRGIDAITIQGRYRTNSNAAKPSTFVMDYVHKLEITLRGLSNLHERLHHSTTLYLLPNPKSFVKHEEYLVPNLLLLIPIVLRAALLGLADIRRFDLSVMGWILLITIGATFSMDANVAQREPAQRNAWLCLIYVTCFGILYEKILNTPRDRQNALQSAQLMICLMTIYSHVPCCFGNVAISFPSAFFWAPCVAFPTFSSLHEAKVGSLGMLAWLVLSGSVLFWDASTTPYIRFLYFPLHLALSLSCLLGMLQVPKKR